MKYIKPEEFLEQPKEVQEEFRNWWKPEQYDLFMWDIGGLNRMYIVEEYKEQNNDKYILPVGSPNIWNKKGQSIPLLTEGQLREFIEEKSGKIDCIGITANDYGISTFVKDYKIDYASDLLEAYWKIACKIVSDYLYIQINR